MEVEKKWSRNHIKKGACEQGSEIVEGERQDNVLEDGA